MGILQSICCEGVNWSKDFAVITAKTFSGKTYSAIYELREYIESKTNPIDKVILLTPHRRQRKQMLKEYAGDAIKLDYDFLRSTAFNARVEKTIVSTYAGLCNALKDKELSLDRCLVIFDELHTFIENTSYQENMSYLLEWLLEPDKWESFVAVGMTGTPQILNYANKCGLCFEFKDITPITEQNLTCENGLFINGGSALTYAKKLIQSGFDGAKLIYVESAKVCYQIASLFNDAGYQAAFIVSEYHDRNETQDDIPLNEAMRNQIYDGVSIIDWIDENNNVPKCLNVLIINSSARDGININDDALRFDEAIIESTNKATVEQARSRIRHNLDQLTVIYSRKNESRTRLDLEDCISFFNDYENASSIQERKEIINNRLLEQVESKAKYDRKESSYYWNFFST